VLCVMPCLTTVMVSSSEIPLSSGAPPAGIVVPPPCRNEQRCSGGEYICRPPIREGGVCTAHTLSSHAECHALHCDVTQALSELSERVR